MFGLGETHSNLFLPDSVVLLLPPWPLNFRRRTIKFEIGTSPELLKISRFGMIDHHHHHHRKFLSFEPWLLTFLCKTAANFKICNNWSSFGLDFLHKILSFEPCLLSSRKASIVHCWVYIDAADGWNGSHSSAGYAFSCLSDFMPLKHGFNTIFMSYHNVDGKITNDELLFNGLSDIFRLFMRHGPISFLSVCMNYWQL